MRRGRFANRSARAPATGDEKSPGRFARTSSIPIPAEERMTPYPTAIRTTHAALIPAPVKNRDTATDTSTYRDREAPSPPLGERLLYARERFRARKKIEYGIA